MWNGNCCSLININIEKISKALWDNDIHNLQDGGGGYCCNSSYLWSFRHFSTILWSPRRWIGVMKNRNWCRWTNIYPKNIKGSMGQPYPYPTRWKKKIVAIIHIYGTLAIFLLFCNLQYTGSESWEIEIGVSGPILTQKIMKVYIVQQYTYCTIWEENVLVIIHIYGARDNFYYCLIAKTLNPSNLKWEWAYLTQYSPIKRHQRLYGTTISIL